MAGARVLYRKRFLNPGFGCHLEAAGRHPERRGTMMALSDRRRSSQERGGRMSQQKQNEERDGTLPCPKCQGEMHPMFLYEDRDPDVWLCFSCGHLEWTNAGAGRAIPSVDE